MLLKYDFLGEAPNNSVRRFTWYNIEKLCLSATIYLFADFEHEKACSIVRTGKICWGPLNDYYNASIASNFRDDVSKLIVLLHLAKNYVFIIKF